MADPKISITNLYKIFGEDPQGALVRAKEGMHKAELLEQHRHALGLRDINVDMKPGEITVIMGLSGSGKSTLIRDLNRLTDPTDGEVWVNGENIMGYSDAKLREMRRKHMSMVFQKFALLPHRTVLENAATPMTVDGRPRSEWAPKRPSGSTASGSRDRASSSRTSSRAACSSVSASPGR